MSDSSSSLTIMISTVGCFIAIGTLVLTQFQYKRRKKIEVYDRKINRYMSLKEKINNCSTKFENPNLDNVENSDDAFTAMTKLKENAFSWHHDMLAIFEIENFLFTQEAKQRIIHAESLVKQFVKLKKKFTENYNKKIPTENCLDEKEQIELHNINFQLSYERCGSDVLKLDLINQLILIETSVYRNLPFIINEEVENMIHYLDNKINE